MSLEELNEQVYKREGEEKPKAPFSFPSQPAPATPPTPEITPTPSKWTDRPIAFKKLSLKEHFLRRKKLIIGLTLGLLAAVSLMVFLGRRTFLFNPDLVEITLVGPEVTETGTPVTFTVRYTNPNWVGLAESELVISYPETFRLASTEGWQTARRQSVRKVAALPGRSEGEVTLTGSFHSFDQATALLTASLRYGPEGLASRAEKRDDLRVELERSLIGIEVNGPPSVMNGQSVEYVVEYRNDGEETLETGEIALEYPEGFTPTSFTPLPKRGDSAWGVSMLKGGMRGSISVKGVMMGRTGDSKRIIARIGKQSGDGNFFTLAEEEKVTQVLAPPLALSLTADSENGVVEEGKTLQFRMTFRNEASFGLRDLVGAVTLDPTKLDVEKLRAPSGAKYSQATNQVTFKAADVPALRSLEPGQGGEVTFSVPVRGDLTARNLKDVEIGVVATMDSPDMPRSTNTEALAARGEVRFKVRTATKVFIDGYFHDAAYPNSGPMPTRVGEETTYTFHLGVESSLNTLTDGRMVMTFPSVVRFLGVISPDQNGVTFNDRTGELSWRMGNVVAGPGNRKMITIRIGLTPPPNSVGQTLDLMNRGEFTARDAFTNTEVKLPIEGKTMELREDPQLTYDQKRVAPSQ